MKNKIVLGLIIGLIVGLLLGFSLGKTNNSIEKGEEIVNETLSQEFEMIINFDEETKQSFSVKILNKSELSLFDLMDKLFSEEDILFDFKEYSGLGHMIVQIGNKKNGEDNKYWQYWVNNKLSSVGADNYIPQVGDLIEWKFVKSQPIE